MRVLTTLAILLAAVSACDKGDAGAGGSGGGSGGSEGSAGDARLAHLSPEEREKLQRTENTAWGYTCYVADELYFKHNGYKYEIRDMVDFVITNPATGKAMSFLVTDFSKQRDDKPAPRMAEELYARMQNELGEPPPVNPNAPPLLEPLFMGHDRAQELRYPEKYRAIQVAEAQAELAAVGQMLQRGQTKEAADETEHIANRLRWDLGPEDPLFIQTWNLYTQLTGRVLCYKEENSGMGLMRSSRDLSPQEAAAQGYPLPPILTSNAPGQPAAGVPGAAALPPAAANQPPSAPPALPGSETLEQADEHLRIASERWAAGDKEGSMQAAREALRIRTSLLGESHPKTLEVKQMIQNAGN